MAKPRWNRKGAVYSVSPERVLIWKNLYINTPREFWGLGISYDPLTPGMSREEKGVPVNLLCSLENGVACPGTETSLQSTGVPDGSEGESVTAMTYGQSPYSWKGVEIPKRKGLTWRLPDQMRMSGLKIPSSSWGGEERP